jgi:hypothetical protein
MLYKIQQIFERITFSSDGMIKDKEHLDLLNRKLLERKIIIEHDIPLINKYIVDFPFNFEQFCFYIRQIFKLDIENQLENKISSYDDCLSKIIKYLNFYSYSELSADDLYEVLSNLNFNLDNINSSMRNIQKVDFLLKNIRDDIQKFLWERIDESEVSQNENNNPEFFIHDAVEYHQKMQAKIEYEYEIIRTKRIHFNTDPSRVIKKIKKIQIEKARCADRDIPIQTWKVPNNFFDRELLTGFFYKCEALRELLLSKYFQKFAGFDDLSFDDFQLYFFEWIEGVNLIQLIKDLDLEISESAILFRYLAKEILTAFRDLLYKCTYSVKFPVTIENLFYEVSQQRLYLNNLEFGPIRKTILESHQIVEAKLLYFYGLILLNLLSMSKPELEELVIFIHSICNDFHEFDHMQKIFDHIFQIEEVLTRNLENDVIISIIIECLISPYKAKLVFDEFYQKKNFLPEILKKRSDSKYTPTKKQTDVVNLETLDNDDKLVVYENYYTSNNTEGSLKEESNESLPKKTMSLNLLLIHPFFENLKLDKSFISFMFKNN